MGSSTIPHGHYVALSRVRTASGLHILQLNKMKIKVSDAVITEMRRLREESCMCYTPFYLADKAFLKVTFQNARSLHKHYTDLSNDHNITSSDIISVVESRLKPTEPNQQYSIPNFTIVRNDQVAYSNSLTRPPHGQIFYIHEQYEILKVSKYSSTTF